MRVGEHCGATVARECATWDVRLLDGFEARRDGTTVAFPPAQQQLIAFLALDAGTPAREHVATSLWPETPDDRAAANLRTTVWRLRRRGGDLLESQANALRLRKTVRVDVDDAMALAYRLLADPDSADADSLRGEVLPGWDQPWVHAARERFHHLRVHAIEQRAAHLVTAGRRDAALQLAAAAVAIDPHRESARRLLLAAEAPTTSGG